MTTWLAHKYLYVTFVISILLTPMRVSAGENNVWVSIREAYRGIWNQSLDSQLSSQMSRVRAEADGSFLVSSESMLLLPTNTLDQWNIRGANFSVGMVYGRNALAITWTLSTHTEEQSIEIPWWSSARFIAIRSENRSTRVAVLRAERTIDAQVWSHADNLIQKWIDDEQPAIPLLSDNDANRIVQNLHLERKRHASNNPRKQHLWEMWLEESVLIRPIVEPYFARTKFNVDNALEVKDALYGSDIFQDWYETGSGPVHIQSPNSNVMRIAFKRYAMEESEVWIYAGKELVRTLHRASPKRDQRPGYEEAETIRIVPLGPNQSIRLEVKKGAIRFSVAPYSWRPSWKNLMRSKWDLPNDTPMFHATTNIDPNELSKKIETGLLTSRFAMHDESLQRMCGNALDNTLWVQLGCNALFPKNDGARPSAAMQMAEKDDEIKRFARMSLQTESAFHRIEPTVVRDRTVEWLTAIDENRSPMCEASGPYGLRWTVMQKPEQTISVAAHGDAYAKTTFRTLSDDVKNEFLLRVDDAPISIHTGGQSSFAAIRPGERRFSKPINSADLLIRIARQGMAPCVELRDRVVWNQVSSLGGLDFIVPGSGAATILRFITRAEKNSELTVRIHDRAQSIWVERGESSFDFIVNNNETAVHLSSTNSLQVQLFARLHPFDHVGHIPSDTVSDVDGAAVLSELRKIHQNLQSAPLEETGHLIRQRDEVMNRLGFSTLLSNRAQVNAVLGSDQIDWVIQPFNKETVVPLGTLSRIDPLALPENTSSLHEAIVLFHRGNIDDAIEKISSESIPLADMLLKASLCDRVSKWTCAAQGFEQIGLQLHSGAAMAHAASRWANESAKTENAKMALRSYADAHQALQFGDLSRETLGRLDAVIQWAAPAYLESLGSAQIETTATSNPTWSNQVKQAMLDAPEGASLVDPGQQAILKLDQPGTISLAVEKSCDRVRDPQCDVMMMLNGKVQQCSNKQCNIQVAKGKNEIRMVNSSNGAAWVRAQLRGETIFPLLTSTWYEVGPGSVAKLGFASPTVIRIRARVADVNAPLRLRWKILDKQGNIQTGVEDVVTTPDALSMRILGGKNIPIGIPVEIYVPVRTEGIHEIQLESELGRGFVRVDVANAIGAAPFRLRDMFVQGDTKSAQEDKRDTQDNKPFFPNTSTESQKGVGLWGATFRLIDGNLSGDDYQVSRSYAELQAHAFRELEVDQSWMGLHLFQRLRNGPESSGGGVFFERLPSHWIPGLIESAGVVIQPTSEYWGWGIRSNSTIHVTAFESAWVDLDLGSEWIIQHADERMAAIEGADSEVYSPYAFAYPGYAEGFAKIKFQSWYDARARVDGAIRMIPTSDWIDRYDVRFLLDVLGVGRDASILGFEWLMSVRPITNERVDWFVRDRLLGRFEAWDWVRSGGRLRAGIELGGYVDTPSANHSASEWLVNGFFGIDFSGTRGLRDLPASFSVFRSQQEIGSGRRRTTREDSSIPEVP